MFLLVQISVSAFLYQYQSSNMAHILAQIKPNNQLVIKTYRLADGYGRRASKKGTQEEQEHAYQSRLVSAILAREKIHKYYGNDQKRLHACSGEVQEWAGDVIDLDSPSMHVERLYSTDQSEAQRLSLDLLEKSQQSASNVRKWGLPQKEKVFRKAGADKILQGGGIFDKFISKGCSYMVTLTLPGSTDSSMDALARWSGYVVNRIMQVCRRWNCPESPLHWFFVWEHQKRGALHLHLCLGADNQPLLVEKFAHAIKDKWFEVLKELGNKLDIDMFARKGFSGSWANRPSQWRWDIQPVRKSVAAYFAKYCIKNRKASEREAEKSPGRKNISFPSRYWGSSYTVKAAIKCLGRNKKTTTFSDSETSLVVSRMIDVLLSDVPYLSTWSYQFQVEGDASDVVFASGEATVWTFDPCYYRELWKKFVVFIEDREIASITNSHLLDRMIV